MTDADTIPSSSTGSGDAPVDVTLRELATAVAQLPGGGEPRPGQVDMAREVAEAAHAGRHVVVRAGTGTGKTLGYLVPAIVSGQRVVVATATRALQDQLATKDLPFLQKHLSRRFTWAVLKGRSNYVCRQRLAEVRTARAASSQLELDGLAQLANRDQLKQIFTWAEKSATGDRAELEHEPTDSTWAAVSTSSRDCPGASRCPEGAECFAQQARDTAALADIVVVNMHLYGLHLASGEMLLPEHDLVILDEAHVLDDVISATSGLELSPGRVSHLARMASSLLSDEDGQADAGLSGADQMLASALRPLRGLRVPAPRPAELAAAVTGVRERVAQAQAALAAVPESSPETVRSRALRARQAATALLDDLDAAMQPSSTEVSWVEGNEASPLLRVAPLDVAGLLRSSLWDQRAAVLTSATIAPGYGRQVGLPAEAEVPVDVGSPFNYQENGLIYCAVTLPPPRAPEWADAVLDELELLIDAAGGRTLALFTSYKAMGRAVEVLGERLDYPILAQGDLPKAKLVEKFSAQPELCLFATMSFWQGIDVPGPSLSLVTIDRLPFPRPDEPLLEARRERLGQQAFLQIDVPRAATLLAQGTGRLLRSRADRGAVAVLDPRLATARYGPKIVGALPKMRRTRERDDVVTFLRGLRGA